MKHKPKPANGQYLIPNNIISIPYCEEIVKKKNKTWFYANSQKVIAYSSYWILVKKPIQIINNNSDNKALLSINERFVLQYILSYLSERKREAHILLRENPGLKNFASYLLYYLVYRVRDAQSLEMMIVSFLLVKYMNVQMKISVVSCIRLITNNIHANGLTVILC